MISGFYFQPWHWLTSSLFGPPYLHMLLFIYTENERVRRKDGWNFFNFKMLLFWSSPVVQLVKDLALSLQGQRFAPWPRNFHVLQVQPKKQFFEGYCFDLIERQTFFLSQSFLGIWTTRLRSKDESLCCTPETNTTLEVNDTSVKKKKFFVFFVGRSCGIYKFPGQGSKATAAAMLGP